jgi:hypothetical protein
MLNTTKAESVMCLISSNSQNKHEKPMEDSKLCEIQPLIMYLMPPSSAAPAGTLVTLNEFSGEHFLLNILVFQVNS